MMGLTTLLIESKKPGHMSCMTMHSYDGMSY